MAYERVTGPLGPERLDLLFAIVAATVSNTARGKNQRAKEPKDFLPKWDVGAPGMHWEEMLAEVRAMNARMGGTDLTNGGADSDGSGRDLGSGRDGDRRSDQWSRRRRR